MLSADCPKQEINKVFRGKRPLTQTILQALKLKKVYTAMPAAQMKTRCGQASSGCASDIGQSGKRRGSKSGAGGG